MPKINADGCAIHVEVEGPERAPVLMLSNSLGTNLHMWDEQVAPFTRHFRLVRYDRRGHGQSDVPKGPYSMERLGRDVLAILDGLGIERTNWCGLSMGGMVGQWLGAHAPNRIDKLILSKRPATFMPELSRDGRLKLVREQGLAAIVDANWSAGSPSHFANARRKRWRAFATCFWPPARTAISPAARRFATWTTVRCWRRSLRQLWSLPAGMIQPRHSRPASFIAQHIPGANACRARDRAHCQYRAAAGLRRHGAGIFAGQVTQSVIARSKATKQSRSRRCCWIASPSARNEGCVTRADRETHVASCRYACGKTGRNATDRKTRALRRSPGSAGW